LDYIIQENVQVIVFQRIQRKNSLVLILENLFLKKREQKRKEREGGMGENPPREQKKGEKNVNNKIEYKIYIFTIIN
jgi:hypothetical protein